jgi:hypothetical protein
MANAFKNHGKNLTDATLTTVFTASTETVVHSITICNTNGTDSINASVSVTDTSASLVFPIISTAPIPADSTMVFADVKLNVENTDLLRAQSSHASGNLTVFCSTLEIT